MFVARRLPSLWSDSMNRLFTLLLVATTSAGCGKGQENRSAPPPPPPAPTDTRTTALAEDARPPVDAPSDPLVSICPRVLARIVECRDDPAFASALTAGTSNMHRMKIRELIDGISDWPINPCPNLLPSYEVEGFLDRWDELADPTILESCDALGTAVKAAGGLFGGEGAE
jgi:hypothetical protein